jgi:hypothetical protein
VTAITPLDYLDHTIPRLGLQQVLPDAKFSLTDSDLRELRRRTETILVLCATSYQFSYHSPSLLAASAILSALYSLSSRPIYTEVVARELKLRIQTVTHTATVSTFEAVTWCISDFRFVPMLKTYSKTGDSPSY